MLKIIYKTNQEFLFGTFFDGMYFLVITYMTVVFPDDDDTVGYKIKIYVSDIKRNLITYGKKYTYFDGVYDTDHDHDFDNGIEKMSLKVRSMKYGLMR